MPDNLFGLPTHVLAQHVVVVLLPIAAAAALLVALWAWYRHCLELATLVATFLVTLFVPLTTQSGESLASRLPSRESSPPTRRPAIGSSGWPPSSGSAYSLSSQWISGAGCRRRWDFGPDGRAHLARRRRDRGPRCRDSGQAFGFRAVWSDYPNLRP